MNCIGTFTAYTALVKRKYIDAKDTLLVTTHGVTMMVKNFAKFFGYKHIIVPDYTTKQSEAPAVMVENTVQQQAIVTVSANDIEDKTIDAPTDFNDSKNLRIVQIDGLKHFKKRNPEQPYCVSCYPGCGKTLLALIISLHLYKEGKIDTLIISTKQRTVTEQTMKRAEAFFEAHGINVDVRLFDSDGDNTIEQFNSIKRVQLLVIMTTDRSSERLAVENICTDKTLTIFDECHHMGNETKALFQASKNPPVLMSGTIAGMSAKFIGDIDTENHFTYGIKEAIDDGILCKYNMVIPVRPGPVKFSTEDPDFEKLVGFMAAFYMTVAMRWLVIEHTCTYDSELLY
jgi:superfamily II DNA or RNA helicase